ncbi:MAG: hypothetical protein Q9211_000667 [Gyalolechia sp. 1 TL-2023]
MSRKPVKLTPTGQKMPQRKSEYGKGVKLAYPLLGAILLADSTPFVSHPADVMVSKSNANRQAGEAFRSAMGRIYKDIGFRRLWDGLVTRIFMIAALTSLHECPTTRLCPYSEH